MSTLHDPIDGSPPGSSIHGIFQARTLEWVAISFSNAWKWKEKVKSLSRVRLLATSWTAAFQAPPSVGFSRQEYWNGVPLPSPQGMHIHSLICCLYCILWSQLWKIKQNIPSLLYRSPSRKTFPCAVRFPHSLPEFSNENINHITYVYCLQLSNGFTQHEGKNTNSLSQSSRSQMTQTLHTSLNYSPPHSDCCSIPWTSQAIPSLETLQIVSLPWILFS